jgi:hypothetical protein
MKLLVENEPLITNVPLSCKLNYIPLTLYPEGIAEASQIFLRDAHVLPKLSHEETTNVTGGKPIAV